MVHSIIVAVAVLGLISLRPTRWQLLYQLGLLAAAVLLAPSQLLALAGLAYFALSDWQSQTVPALGFDGWCLLVALTTPSHWLVGLGWLVALSGLSIVTQGLGSADVLAISALTLGMPALASLVFVLMACVIGVGHGLVRPGTIPFLVDLQLAYLLMVIVS
ncbi:hypothetical protein ACFQ41_00075 [Lacticaseibacillus suilingensis]|uniref:Prepilin type IV endopeptidase peptidase domain-containing protein n=1 Tax=Lacticaseibacillus suilingensis TaxID=2799577 RepID=A0ABW4BBR7_9LACO|nr:hypothetical protein [Lacticaseibacillus suilingensis]MCI2017670.1 hypothetical protein [Lactobacillus sp.]